MKKITFIIALLFTGLLSAQTIGYDDLTLAGGGGGGGGSVTEAHETLVAVGAETTWVLTNTPDITKHYWVTRNGLTLYEDAAGDYTISGNTITWDSALLAGDIVQIWYKY